MKKYLSLFALLLTSVVAAQHSPAAVRITYERASNGKPIENQDRIVVLASAMRTDILSQSIIDRKATYPFEQSYIDRSNGHHIQVAQLREGQIAYTIDSVDIAKQKFEFTSDTKTILGYTCKRAKTEINSNKIDIWYTNELGLKGAPTALGQQLGLVLQVERNGNFAITAVKIDRLKKAPAAPLSMAKGHRPVDMLTYRDLLWKSRFIQLPVFAKEVINFTDKPQPNDSVFRFANGTVIARKVTFPAIKPGHRVFVDAVHQSNGDAYDRTGSVFMIPDSKTSYLDALQNSVKMLPVYDNGNGKTYQGVIGTADYTPPVELMRFFTPFGVSHFNHIKIRNRTWQDSVTYRQDITELAALLSNRAVWIGAGISNYDKGGHKLSVNITIHPDEPQSEYNVVMPLFQTHNIMEAAGQEYPTMFNSDKGLQVRFALEKPVKNAMLRYIATGHGGWENGDEFVQKTHTITLDGKEVHRFIPWRVDCGSYRDYNPASGNFSNGLSSSDYSRSNWCPGTLTNPVYIPLGDLPAGDHTIQVTIPQGAPEGSSFSAWAISGVLLGK